MNPQMKDKRKAARKKLMAFTPVYDANHKILLGYIKNLSVGGLMMIAEKAVETHEDRLLNIEFPDADLPDLISPPIVISAHAVWCKRDEDQPYYDIGFEFTEVTPEHAAVFKAIMARYQFRQDMPGD